MEIAVQDALFYEESGGGVTISGGEPVVQPGFVLAIAQACHEASIHVALDTSGFADAAVFEALVGEVDLVLYDVKAVDAKLHQRGTGRPNDVILRNLRRLARRKDGPELVVRRPVLPGYNDDNAELTAFIELMDELDHPEVELLPYHRMGEGKRQRLLMGAPVEAWQAPASEDVAEAAERWQQALAGAGVKCHILNSQTLKRHDHAKAT